MSLRNTLVTCLKTAQSAHERECKDFNMVVKNFELSGEPAEKERKKRTVSLKTKVDAKTEEGVAAIDARIAELDAADARAKRMFVNDAEGLARLQSKILLLESVGVDGMSDEDLKLLLAEFEDNSFALAALRKAIDSPMRCKVVLPTDSTGEPQRRLESIRKQFNDAMAFLGSITDESDAQSAAHAISQKAIIAHLIATIEAQNDDFSRDDLEVQREAHANAPGGFGFQFKRVH